MNKEETVVVLNTATGKVGDIRRRLFDSAVFNPNRLLVEIEDTRSGCEDCGIAPADEQETASLPEAVENEIRGYDDFDEEEDN